MPPKNQKKQAEVQELDVVTEKSTESEDGDDSVAGSTASQRTITSDHLDRILDAQHRNMADLIAALRTTSPSRPSHTGRTQIKPPKWSDEDTLYEYFHKFEKAMTHNSVDRRQWGHLLPVYLTGRAQSAYSQVQEETLDDFEAVKAIMLKSLEDTPASADQEWWTLSRRSGEAAGAYYLRVQATGTRRIHGLKTRKEIKKMMILSRFLSTLPPDCYNCVIAKQPKTGLEAARFVQEFEESRIFSRRNQSWRAGQGQPHQASSGRGSNDYG